MIAIYVEITKLRMENQKLKIQLADQKAMNRAFLCDTEREILNRIHAIKCRDEVPNKIFLGKKEWDSMKTIAGNPMNSGPSEASEAWYCGCCVIRVKKATFVDVSTVQ